MDIHPFRWYWMYDTNHRLSCTPPDPFNPVSLLHLHIFIFLDPLLAQTTLVGVNCADRSMKE